MDNAQQFSWLLIIIGILVILVSIFAHSLGIGSSGFGTKKLIGVIVGAVILVAGLANLLRSSRVQIG